MKRPLIIANWKGYVADVEEACVATRVLARGAKKIAADMVVCPPAPFLVSVANIAARASVAVGAQTISSTTEVKATGEITAQAVASLGVKFVLVGHSERRARGESNEDVCAMVTLALEAKLSPVVCIGEKERGSAGEHFALIEQELRESLPKMSPRDAKSLVIAYEPVWAIGKTSADAMTPENLEETTLFIRKVLADIVGRAQALQTPVLYGGSVESDNAEHLMRAGVSGFLVGHASVDPKSLLAIASAAAHFSATPKRNKKHAS